MALVLLVDDDDHFRDMLQAMLQRLGHTVAIAANGKAALARYTAQLPDLVITDLIMPEKDGLELIRELRRTPPLPPIIAVSGGGRTQPEIYLQMAESMGARAVLAKPFTFHQLSAAIDAAGLRS